MTTVSTPMQRLERRLISTGFPRAYIKVLTPDWWDKSLESSSQSVLMFKMHLAKHLGLDLASLMDDRKRIKFQPAGRTHYRLTQDKIESDVVLAQSMAESLAKIVAAATTTEYKPLPSDPRKVRQALLRGNSWINLESLVEYLWKRGVPVIHLKKLPGGSKKFDGMVVDVDGRPVIVLTRGNKAPAWQLFILAHEAGHIGKGHVKDGTVFFDEKVQGSDSDDKEVEATEYGMHLLTGDKDTCIGSKQGMNAHALSRSVLAFGRNNKIDPGHVALNYRHTMNRMPVAQAVLKALPEQYDAPKYITAVMKKNIDMGLLPDDSKDILERLM